MADVKPPLRFPPFGRKGRSLRAACAHILLGASLILPASVNPQETSAQEQQIKAAYLYKFGGYVEWPAEAFPDDTSPVVIAIAGDASLVQEVEKVVGNRTLNGRPIEIRPVMAGADIGHPHILFLARSQLNRMNTLTSHPRPVLIVTDASNGLDQGSVINFVTTGNRVRFEVSLDAARRNTLKIAAPLLAVAMRVQ